jgi:type I restriction enzyme M protein
LDQASHNKIVSVIWGIADDVLRDLFVRGNYRDVVTLVTADEALRAYGVPTL